MPTDNTSRAPRTHIRVVRSDGREYPTMSFAWRELMGTHQELTVAEVQRIRAEIRAAGIGRDRHGFTWRSMGGLVPETTINWTDFTFGVELELYAPFNMYEMRDRLARELGVTDWDVRRDGSLPEIGAGWYPMEVVSPILKGESGMAAMKRVMDLIRAAGCKVNNKCGTHAHIGVRGMIPARVKKIAVAFLNAERHFDELVAPSRRASANRYCQSNVALVRSIRSAERLAAATSIRDLANAMNGGNDPQHYTHYRYYKLNFQSFVHHGTIEFRQHQGTVEFEKLSAWVRMIAGFCAKAAAQPEETLGAECSFEEWLPTVTDAAGVTYLTERRERLAQLARRSAVAA